MCKDYLWFYNILFIDFACCYNCHRCVLINLLTKKLKCSCAVCDCCGLDVTVICNEFCSWTSQTTKQQLYCDCDCDCNSVDCHLVDWLHDDDDAVTGFCLLFWRYKRIFSVGTRGITTYNPSTLEVTNQVDRCCYCSVLYLLLLFFVNAWFSVVYKKC